MPRPGPATRKSRSPEPGARPAPRRAPATRSAAAGAGAPGPQLASASPQAGPAHSPRRSGGRRAGAMQRDGGQAAGQWLDLRPRPLSRASLGVGGWSRAGVARRGCALPGMEGVPGPGTDSGLRPARSLRVWPGAGAWCAPWRRDIVVSSLAARGSLHPRVHRSPPVPSSTTAQSQRGPRCLVA